MIKRVLSGAFAFAALLFSMQSVQAQTVQQIAQETKARAVQRAASVNNYTIVFETMGSERTQYLEKQMVDGFPVFVPRQAAARAGGARGRAGGGRGNGDESEELIRMTSGLLTSQQALQRSKHEGNETVDGKRTHKIVISDVASIDAVRQVIEASGNSVAPKTITMFIDAAQYVPLKMVVVADATVMGRTAEVTITQLMQDYRTVDGLLHPFKTITSIEGMGNVMQISPEQLAQARQMIAQLPPDQRAAAEQMMNSMGGGSQPAETVVITKSLRVNTGPPGGGCSE